VQALVEQADDLLGHGKAKEAALLYDRVLVMDAHNIAAYLGLSAALSRQGQHAAAVDRLNRSEAVVGWKPVIASQIGVHQVALKQWEKAQATLERVLASEGTAFEAAFYLGEAYLQTGKFDRAVATLSTYLQTRPTSLVKGDAQVRVRLALALLRSGQPGKAELHLEKAHQERPNDASVKLLLSDAKAALGQCRDALQILDGLIESLDAKAKQEAPSLYYTRAACLLQLRRNVEALADLKSYEELRPNSGQASALRGTLEWRLDRVDLALASFRKAKAAGMPVDLELGTVLLRTGRADEAAEILGPMLRKETRNVRLLEVGAEALLQTGNTSRALEVAARLASLRPKDAKAHTLRGRIALAARMYTTAADSFGAALSLDSSDKAALRGQLVAWEQHARALVQERQLGEARTLLERAAALSPTSGSIAQNLALVCLASGDAKRAASLLEPLVAKAPRAFIAARLLGRAQADAGLRVRAVTTLKRLAGNPDAPKELRAEVMLDWAAMVREDEPEEALALALRAQTLIGVDHPLRAEIDAQLPQIRLAAAESLLAANRPQAALDLLDAVRAQPLVGRETTARASFVQAVAQALISGNSSAFEILSTISDEALGSMLAPAVRAGGRDFARLYLAFLSEERLRPVESRDTLQAGDRLLAAATVPPELKRDVRDMLAAWLDHLLRMAAKHQSPPAMAKLLKAAPAVVDSPAYRHNSVLVDFRGAFSPQAVQVLEDVADTVPEAYVNLAMAAMTRGDHTMAVRHLRQAVNRKVTSPELQRWLEWEEHFYGEQQ
jgi:tetratricopeptide (TPR) repeat protein